jgi:mannonate dehydratase
MDRRDVLQWISRGTVAGAAVALSPGRLSASRLPPEAVPARPGLPPLKITDVETILTAPDGIRLVVVKVTTSEPGLYGLGCCQSCSSMSASRSARRSSCCTTSTSG